MTREPGKRDFNMKEIFGRASARKRPACTSDNAHAASRHYCRNPRCRSKLREPVDNHHHAFCCKGCFEIFYRRRCRVCERDISRNPLTGEARKGLSRRKYCGRKCTNEAERFSRAYAWIGSQPRKPEMNPRSADEMGLESGSRGRSTTGMAGRAV